jgi:hypothetical protein
MTVRRPPPTDLMLYGPSYSFVCLFIYFKKRRRNIGTVEREDGASSSSSSCSSLLLLLLCGSGIWIIIIIIIIITIVSTFVVVVVVVVGTYGRDDGRVCECCVVVVLARFRTTCHGISSTMFACLLSFSVVSLVVFLVLADFSFSFFLLLSMDL